MAIGWTSTQPWGKAMNKVQLARSAFLLIVALAACSPVVSTPATENSTVPASQEVLVYVYDPVRDTVDGVMRCSAEGLVAVTRLVNGDLEGEALIEATIEQLLAGDLSSEELEQGLTTEFPLEGVELLDVALNDGTATVALDDPQFQTSGGACRVGIINGQVAFTVMQFEGVNDVRLLPDELFQP